LADRLDADGIHLTDPKVLDADAQAKLADRGMIVGIGGINTRHLALQVGEREPDYLFFGRTDRDATEETHPKTVTLATWWAQMMKIPCVALSGTSDEAFTSLAEAGVEFLAVREQIWNADDPGAEVARLNTMLDAIAHKRAEAAA
jgi:thiamine-phosphate pyrophosphorylase